MKEKTKHYLLGAMMLMCMIVFGTKNETYALSTYLPEEYYSDVVEKEVTLQKLQDGAKADSDDKYLVVDHEECWGTRDCTIFHLPEDGTVKISLKNIAEQRMYGSNVLLFSNKDLTKKINLELEVDGGEETSGSVYLEAGTYYMFTTSKNYDGNEFVEGNKAICRRTKVWVGYVPQSAFLSVNQVALAQDKKSTVITLNIPEQYASLRVEDYFIGYEDVKDSAKWQTDSRANMLEGDTYTAKKNGWYSFRLCLNKEQEKYGWGYICHVLVSGIDGKTYEESGVTSDNLPVVDQTGKTVVSISSRHDLDNKIDEGLAPVYEIYDRKYTKETFSITVKKPGTLYLKGYSQANYWMYSPVNVELFYDKNKKAKHVNFSVDGSGENMYTLLPGTYQIQVTTAENSEELNSYDYAERHFALYAGFFEADQTVNETIRYSEGKKMVTVDFQAKDSFSMTDINVYDYEVNKILIADNMQGKALDISGQSVNVDKNGIYTVYIKSDGNDGPAYILKTFEINNIDGPDYSKEEHEAPAEEIPYVADYSQLLNNIQNGQVPILTHTQYRQSYSKAKKIVLTERTMLYSYISDICNYGFYNVKAGIYEDFQCTKEVVSIDINSAGDGYLYGTLKPGTYYLLVNAGSNQDGIDIYQEINWYIGGVKLSDIAKEPVINYDKDHTKATVQLGLLDHEKISKINCYRGVLDYSQTKAANSSLVFTASNTDTVTLTENGDYTISIFPEEGRPLYSRGVVTVTVRGLVEKKNNTDQKKDETEEKDKTEEKTETEEKDKTQEKNEVKEKSDEENKKPVSDTKKVKDGDVFWSGKIKYKVTSVKNKTVSVTGTKKDISKNVLIPDKVTYRKKSYKVTVIDAKAFKNRKNITKVTIGKNVTKIGKEAFYGDKKLKTIVIRSTKITFIGKNALKGIDAKATIKVPVKKRNAYSTILKKKGQASTVKIQK